MRKSLLVLTILSLSFPALAQQQQTASRKITIDVSKVLGPLNRNFNACVGAGRANEGLRADWQRQLQYAKEQCGFRYIRMHGLLTDDMGVYFGEDRNGQPIYNWQYIDELYDFFERIGIKPFVEFGFMPQGLASGSKTIFWWRGNVTPPRDYAKWGHLIRSLVQHWTERYGEEKLKEWYFEVWNEPNLKDGFWTGDQAEYFKLYKVTAEAVKSVSPAYRVGGPATAGSAWVPEFIDFCVREKAPVDFVSTHTYGVEQGFLDEMGGMGTKLSKKEDAVSGEIRQVRRQIAASALPGLELHYTEWSASYTPADPIHDSYHEAAYILEKIRQSGDAVQSMSYWTFTDIFEEPGIRTTPFHGGFGLINYQDINKAAFYGYKYLNRLGDQALQNSDASSWACRDNKGNVQLLCWDFTNTHPGDTVNNQSYYNRDLPPNNKGSLAIELNKLPPGKYQLNVYKTGYRANDAYTSYLDLGAPGQLTRPQVAEIKAKNADQPKISKTITVGKEGVFRQELPLRENDVYCVLLERR
ncbi:MAG: glycoside hydrolase [Candidatus Pseudobacter hemicellulosilyticus]|uniref:Glycoside hydrolase n=1 Tax=Candidatus Pseudobacter hemicellulosilyticus TaxID=3121375 RepID=A0AAJ5WV74_9BACT|nr:MAG: glycoside hydrolase [Pseudobacter sp.]